MNITLLKYEIEKRLIGTKIKIISLTRHCGRIEVKYSHKSAIKNISVADCDIDRNDPAGSIAGDILMEEAK